MTTQLYISAGSAAVVVLMIGVAAALGFRKAARIEDEAHLARMFAEFEPDARIESALIDANGRAALARLADGRLLAARAMGADISMRFAVSGQTWLRRKPGKLIVALGDVGFPHLHLRLKDNAEPPAWIVQLASRQG